MNGRPATSRPRPLDDLLAELARTLVPVTAPERSPLDDLCGRVLAEDVAARLSMPPWNNSAMDGYALRAGDLAPDGETALPVVGTAAAGHPFDGDVPPGAAARIFTGAPLPAGLDTVVPQEDATRDGDLVRVPPGRCPGRHVRTAGEDFAAGDVLLRAGTRLDPRHVALLASAGHDGAMVRTRLRVAVFSTGDELVPPGASPGPGRIADSNRPMVAALARLGGARVTDLGCLRDDAARVRAALAAAARDHDVLITSGGVSVGDADHVAAAVAALGTLESWKVAMKPGKPLALGRIGGDGGRTARFLGLPGNPVSAFVTFCVVGRAVLARLSGQGPEVFDLPFRSARLAGALTRKPGRREFLRVALEHAANGPPRVRVLGNQGSAVLATLARADALMDLPEETDHLADGAGVRVLMLTEMPGLSA